MRNGNETSEKEEKVPINNNQLYDNQLDDLRRYIEKYPEPILAKDFEEFQRSMSPTSFFTDLFFNTNSPFGFSSR